MLLLVTACGLPPSDWDGLKLWIRDKFPEVKTVTTDELAGWIANEQAPILLDVRTKDEYAVSHLRNARRALTESEAVEALRGVEPDARVVVYCSVGYRSAKLASALQERGFRDVYNLEGSIFEWANEGRPVYSDGQRVDKVHPYDSKWGKLLDPEWH